jgi:flagellar hook-associated protein 1 FlgK
MLGDLFAALRTSQSGLIANQRALSTVAQNVANVNTPGYSRKEPTLEQRVVDGTGAGVDLTQLKRTVDEGLLKTIRLETASLQQASVRQDYLGRVQTLFGSPESDSSLSHTITEFQDSLEGLALEPNSALNQRAVVRSADDLGIRFRELTGGLQSLRQEADQEIGTAVREVNGLLTTIADLNDKIARNGHAGQDTSSLQDQRDQSLDQLAGLMDIRVFRRASGEAVVFTASGRTLVDGTARGLSHGIANQLSAGTGTTAGGIDGIYIGEAAAENDISGEIRAGRLAGLIDLRDTTLPALAANLDTLAGGLAKTVNQVHNRGLAFPGLNAVTGSRTFADPASQAITFQGTSDTRLVVFDGNGNQVGTTTVRTLLGGASGTIADVQAGINTWLGGQGHGSAALDADGRLEIALAAGRTIGFRDEAQVNTPGAAAADALIGFDGDGDTVVDENHTGFAAFFGLNDLFSAAVVPGSAGTAETLSVRADLRVQPDKLSRGTVQWDANRSLTGAYLVSSGDESSVRALATAVGEGTAFAASGELPQVTTGFADYAGMIIAHTAAETASSRSDTARQEELVATLTHKSDSLRGVNLDQELADLMLYEQAYSAAARVMSVMQAMFDALERSAP